MSSETNKVYSCDREGCETKAEVVWSERCNRFILPANWDSVSFTESLEPLLKGCFYSYADLCPECHKAYRMLATEFNLKVRDFVKGTNE